MITVDYGLWIMDDGEGCEICGRVVELLDKAQEIMDDGLWMMEKVSRFVKACLGDGMWFYKSWKVVWVTGQGFTNLGRVFEWREKEDRLWMMDDERLMIDD